MSRLHLNWRKREKGKVIIIGGHPKGDAMSTAREAGSRMARVGKAKAGGIT